MPAARPAWKGQLRLSLVTIGVELFTAIKPGGKATFHQIHKPTGKRIHYSKVVEGVGEVEKKDIRKGYEYKKGDYVLLEDEELDAVKLETKKTLELVQFVDEGEIPPLYFDQPYFVSPVRRAVGGRLSASSATRCARRKKVGVGQLALRGNEYLVALKPYGRACCSRRCTTSPRSRSPRPLLRRHLRQVGQQGAARRRDDADREEGPQVGRRRTSRTTTRRRCAS